MADVKIVIKIPQKWLNDMIREEFTDIDELCVVVQHGIQLPKGCGRLGDLDALEQEMINGIKAGNYEEGYEKYAHINNMDDCVDCVRCADTIIEADKAESEE